MTTTLTIITLACAVVIAGLWLWVFFRTPYDRRNRSDWNGEDDHHD
jgi:hypothetical protein